MKPSPRIRVITVRQPQIARLIAGELDRVRRPMTKFAQFETGNRLWVREPFHLEERFDAYSPTAAKELGAKPYFAADLQRDELPVRLGAQRFARTLLRVWHRQHLCVVQVDRQPLQSISDAEISSEGFSTRNAYAAAWDNNLTLTGAASLKWQHNPHVFVIHFDRIATPVDRSEAIS